MIEQASAKHVLSLVESIIASVFPGRRPSLFPAVFEKTKGLFEGQYPGYQRCDTAYHDFSHTCDITVATARILDGHIKSNEAPWVAMRDFELALAAALLHDSGFIKEVGDNEGTGAKYAPTHVARGVDLAGAFLPALEVGNSEIHMVQLAIRCTELNVDVSRLKFRDERERFLSCAVAAGDLLGQMAAADYPERLPLLYAEHQEAYTNVDDLLRRTRNFYETHVKRLLDTQWVGVNRALTYHFPSGRNEVLDAIEDNLARIDRVLANSQNQSQREHHHV